MNILEAAGPQDLPTAETCFFNLNIPGRYPSVDSNRHWQLIARCERSDHLTPPVPSPSACLSFSVTTPLCVPSFIWPSRTAPPSTVKAYCCAHVSSIPLLSLSYTDQRSFPTHSSLDHRLELESVMRRSLRLAMVQCARTNRRSFLLQVCWLEFVICRQVTPRQESCMHSLAGVTPARGLHAEYGRVQGSRAGRSSRSARA